MVLYGGVLDLAPSTLHYNINDSTVTWCIFVSLECKLSFRVQRNFVEASYPSILCGNHSYLCKHGIALSSTSVHLVYKYTHNKYSFHNGTVQCAVFHPYNSQLPMHGVNMIFWIFTHGYILQY